jgi:uncharacterized protein (DUF2147 family)
MSRIAHLHTGLITALSAAALTALAACAGAQPGIATASPAAAAERGRWLTESGNLEVEIAPCGEALCGTVVKVIANRSMADPSKTMADAPSPLGMQILTGFKPAGGEWQGQIFNRENGKTYDCLISLEGADQLKVRAYVGSPVMGKTQIWRRVAAAETK